MNIFSSKRERKTLTNMKIESKEYRKSIKIDHVSSIRKKVSGNIECPQTPKFK